MNRLRYNDDKVNALRARRGKRTPDWVLAGNLAAGGGHRCPAAPLAGAPLTFSRKDEASMAIAYEQGGRTNQKHRTRNALVAAARELVAQGVTPSVEEAAALAAIARATAYRYFPNQRALLVAAHPEIERRSLLPEPAPEGPAARLHPGIAALAPPIGPPRAAPPPTPPLPLPPHPRP